MSEFVTIDLPDGRKVRLPAGMSRAEMAEALNKLPKPDAQGRPKWTENVWGAGEADTPGERLGQTINDVGKSVGSGLVRGVTSLADLPGQIVSGAGNLAARGLEAAGAPGMAVGMRDAMSQTPFGSGNAVGQAADMAMPGARSYQPQTTAGEYGQTVGEFLPGAALGPGGMTGNLVRYGVLPGLASEGAGQATEGTKAEPYARAAAAIATAMLAGRPTNNARPLVPRADPEDAKMAETLMREGVRPTVGQVTNSTLLRRMEGSLGDVAGQADDFTAAAMRSTGSTATRATPEALKAAYEVTVKGMDDAVQGVTFRPTTAMAQQADDAVQTYLNNTAQGNIVPAVRNVADEIIDAATNPARQPLSLATLKKWRTMLGQLMAGGNSEAKLAAYELRSIIDDATRQELIAAGRAADVAKLDTARGQFRNWLAIADSATRAGAENGVLSPTQLYQSIIRSQGRRNVATGNTTALGDLARSAAGVLRPEATTSPGSVRTFSNALLTGGAGAGIGAQMMPGNPAVGGLLGLAAGVGTMGAGQAVLRSMPVQSLMMDPIARAAQGLLAGPGVMAGQSK